MKKYWLSKPFIDVTFILAPPFLCLFLIFLFQDKLEDIAEKYSFVNWLLFIVFIDVAHVYSTLYKTYFNPKERQKFKGLLIKLPLISLLSGVVLYGIGSQFFWSVLAYIAVYHFIRQQYGFMRLYARFEEKKTSRLDALAIYNATLFPMMYWFLSSKRQFTWFVEEEFFTYNCPTCLKFLEVLYGLILLTYIAIVVFNYIKYNQFNLQKNVLILGTYLSWYFGIVYFNNDLIFTILNVVSHGVPYIALIYVNQKEESHVSFFPRLKTIQGLLVFLVLILSLAFSEELLWEFTVWNEQIQFHQFENPFEKWQIILVPLLTVPQLTHYLLDGFIWKNK
ncbi:Probable transmembrane protein of unknown function [Flavobacterium indicum GPTSA100-9 = DSM 17447]|uniref:Uncharacterized protein n=1 Tax=Flavobacterium indicum (strain DSM 17447 / CIP 109464 / GPTSA100-9) TaxID=1094466 RepID=H8XNQ2_FLAIG|nr:hypothetical protein [Flavobacterium indicum]CCG52169.1 Probable transmembrane protein of unknown function [Flavobacterium indicum GPTSA100-9 = DSM 17447]